MFLSTWDCYAVVEAWCKKNEELFFLLFVLLDLLHTASHPLFDLGLNV